MFWLTPQTQACQIHHRGGGLSNNELLLSTDLLASSKSLSSNELPLKAEFSPAKDLNLALNSAQNPSNKGVKAQNLSNKSVKSQNPANKTLLLAQNSTQENFPSNSALNSSENSAQSTLPAYQLGAVEVTAPREVDSNPSTTIITTKDIKDSNADNVAQAIRLTPGVMINEAYGQRAEPAINIRGFGRGQVGLYLDGIPVMEIYSRATDYAQYATQGIDSVQISKGFTSPVYGINSLGGAINLISHRPQKELEISMRQKLIFGRHSSPDEVQQGFGIGTNQGKFYVSADVSHTNRSTYPLSGDFEGTTFQKPKDDQNNAYFNNKTAKLKVGIQPNENHEYSLNYIYQRGFKGGLMGENGGQFWKWPAYDKKTLYLLGNSFFTPDLSLNTRLYYDSFYNELESYNAVNTTTGKPNRTAYSWNSIYDDDTYGGILTLSYDIVQDSNLKFGANLKRDHHLESANDKSDLTELTTSIFAQYAQRISDFRFVIAGSYDRADMLNVKYKTSINNVDVIKTDKTKIKGDISVQGVIYYDMSEAQNAHFSVGKKQNMPSLADRYSTRMGSMVQNPDLKVESAINYELGYDLNLASTRVSVAAFYNDLTNMIADKPMPDGTCQDGTGCAQTTNADTGYMYGGEIGFEQGFFTDDLLVVGANYSYIYKKAKGLSDDNTAAGSKITNYPNHMFNAKIAIKPIQRLEFVGLTTLESTRNYFDSSSQSYYKNNNYFTLDISANFELSDGLFINAGVMNVTDRDNQVFWQAHAKNNPTHLAGRRWFAGFDYKY